MAIRTGDWSAADFRHDANELAEDLAAAARDEARTAYDEGRDEAF